MSISIKRYRASDQKPWDGFVRESKNGTFLLLRGYMDYHKDRFDDHSLLVLANDELIALLPANRVEDEVHSHQGLTYGGLVTSRRMTTLLMMDVLDAVRTHLRAVGTRRIFYKTIPAIYHHLPAEEDRYALFRAGALLIRRDALSVIPRGEGVVVQERRRRGAVKAHKAGVVVGKSENWSGYWALLSAHLKQRFGATPVHSVEEIEMLRHRFPENIRLYISALGSEILAGIVVYETKYVARTQYIASSERGRANGALDLLFLTLIERELARKPFIELGSSNGAEQGTLNRGLVEQKEGFGARTVVHDFYRLDL